MGRGWPRLGCDLLWVHGGGHRRRSLHHGQHLRCVERDTSRCRHADRIGMIAGHVSHALSWKAPRRMGSRTSTSSCRRTLLVIKTGNPGVPFGSRSASLVPIRWARRGCLGNRRALHVGSTWRPVSLGEARRGCNVATERDCDGPGPDRRRGPLARLLRSGTTARTVERASSERRAAPTARSLGSQTRRRPSPQPPSRHGYSRITQATSDAGST